MMLYQKIFLLLLLIFFISALSFSQNVDIIPYLKMIESGKKEDAIKELLLLKDKNPNDPNVMFLEALLTEDGKQAVNIYRKILEEHPHSRYADASAYRIYSYYYSLGQYDKAEETLKKMKEEYPISPYLTISQRNISKEDQPSIEEQKPEKEDEEQIITNYKFTIQAGAFSKASNAVSLRNDFENNGFFSEIKEKTVGGTNFKVVYVGKFKNREEAVNFLHVINTEFHLKGRIVELP